MLTVRLTTSPPFKRIPMGNSPNAFNLSPPISAPSLLSTNSVISSVPTTTLLPSSCFSILSLTLIAMSSVDTDPYIGCGFKDVSSSPTMGAVAKSVYVSCAA